MNKEELIEKRHVFFTEIIQSIKSPPSRMDDILNQTKYYQPIDKEGTFHESETGDLAIKIKGEFFEKKFEIYYSFWQIGDMLKIGIAIDDESLMNAFSNDIFNELYYIWGQENNPRIDRSHECLYYDWEFKLPNLYDCYKSQERYILGARHMHFRVMRAISDECQKIKIFNQ